MIPSFLLRVSSLTVSLVPMQSPAIQVRATGAAVTVVVSEDHARLLEPPSAFVMHSGGGMPGAVAVHSEGGKCAAVYQRRLPERTAGL